MINFRFHLASLVAIFLALALGVVIGAGVIDRGVVDTLNSRLDRVAASGPTASRARTTCCGARSASSPRTIAAMQRPRGREPPRQADVGHRRGARRRRRPGEQDGRRCASGGATVTGMLWLEDKWALDDDDEVHGDGRRDRLVVAAPGDAARRGVEADGTPHGRPGARRRPVPDGTDDVLVTPRGCRVPRLRRRGGRRSDLGSSPGRAGARARGRVTTADVPGRRRGDGCRRPSIDAVGLPLVVGDVYDRTAADAGSRGDDVAELRESGLLGDGVDRQRPRPSAGPGHGRAGPGRPPADPTGGRPLRHRRDGSSRSCRVRPLAVSAPGERAVAGAAAARVRTLGWSLVAAAALGPRHAADGAEAYPTGVRGACS